MSLAAAAAAAAKNEIKQGAEKKQFSFGKFMSSAKTAALSFKMPSTATPAKPDVALNQLVKFKLITTTPGYDKMFKILLDGTIKSPYEIKKEDITDPVKLGEIRLFIMSNYGDKKLPVRPVGPDGIDVPDVPGGPKYLNEKQQERIKNILNDSEGDSKIWYDEFIKLYTKIGTPIAYADKVAFNSALAVIDPKIISQGSVGYTIDKIDAYTKTPGPYFIIGTKFANPAVQDEITGGSNYIFMDGNGTISDGMKEHDWGKKDNNMILKPWGTNVKGGATKSRRRKSRKGTRRSR